jgi:hypothetical protein
MRTSSVRLTFYLYEPAVSERETEEQGHTMFS